jgi:formylglycine-generating enzyme required for sulfatase activity
VNRRLIGLTLSLAVALNLPAQNANNDFTAYTQQIPGSAISFQMVPIPAGKFAIGSPASEKDRKNDEGPQRQVAISAFWMGAMEVSRDAFDVFYQDDQISQNSTVDAVTRPSPQYIDFSLGMGKEGGFPVNSLSQYAALMYCRWLYQKTGIFFRLPTAAEWEYACRAGSATPYFFGNNPSELGKYAWFSENSEQRFHRSGEKKPNAWGLYDILGNLSEWTLDHYSAGALEAMPENSQDPMPAFQKAKYPKTLKGGSFTDPASELRSANRIKSDPSWNRRDPQIPKSKWWLTEGSFVGFRIVRPLQQPSKEDAEKFFTQYLGQ